MIKDEISMAAHEAGHELAAKLLGIEVLPSMFYAYDPIEGVEAFTMIKRNIFKKIFLKTYREKILTIGAAGTAAEKLITGRCYEWKDDEEKIGKKLFPEYVAKARKLLLLHIEDLKFLRDENLSKIENLKI